MLGKFCRGKIKKCFSCNKYTLKNICLLCGKNVEVIKPGKFSPDDKYGKYRRLAKKWIAQK